MINLNIINNNKNQISEDKRNHLHIVRLSVGYMIFIMGYILPSSEIITPIQGTIIQSIGLPVMVYV
jgi:hypothetical protein